MTEDLYARGIDESARLDSLTNGQLEHVARGLENNFWMTVEKRTGRIWLRAVQDGNGSAMRMKPEATVRDVWSAAEIISATR